MKPDFFQSACQEAALNDLEFGLCDDQTGGKAYIDNSDKNKWIATVKNDSQKEIVFTAIDKCVLFDNQFPGRGRCDGMLTTELHLYLVELKNQNPPWQQHAIEQLRSTIEMLMENHDISQFRKRKAFAANKRRENFTVIDNEANLSFFRQTTFRLDIQAEIVVI